jgi:hypothetical protein
MRMEAKRVDGLRWLALRGTCALLLICACVGHAWLVVGQSQDKLEVVAKLNEARRSNGLALLAWNPLLDNAAQRHSDDMASQGFVDETGSDGSSTRQRIEAAGYAAWPRQRVWAESIYAGQGSFDEALDFFLSDEGQRRIVLNPKLREVGVGIARDNLRTYWTLTFGSQPNLLPVFINDDAPVTNERQVAVMLTQEEAVPAGDANAIGRVIEVRLSDRPDFVGAEWQPWERLIPFTLSRQRGRQTVYVEMRDGAGRTTIATDSIEYDPDARDTVRPIPPGGEAPSPELAEAATPAPTPTIETVAPSAMAAGGPVAVVVTLAPEATATTRPAMAAPLQAPQAVIVVVPPTTSPDPQALSSESPITTTVILAPTPDGATQQFVAIQTDIPIMEWLVPVYLIAQASVIVLGLFALLRRR